MSDFDDILTDTLIIERVTKAQDDTGGSGGTWATSTSVLGNLQMLPNPVERPQAAGTVAVANWAAYVPIGTSVLAADRLKSNSKAFQVIDSDTERTDGLLLKIFLKRTK